MLGICSIILSLPLVVSIVIFIITLLVLLIFKYLRLYIQFVYPNAKYEAIGNRFVVEKELINLSESKSLHNLKEILNNYKDYKITGDDARALQSSLDEHLVSMIEMMKNDSPRVIHRFYDLYLEWLHLPFIKNTVKMILLGRGADFDKSFIERVKHDKTRLVLKELFNVSKRDELVTILNRYGYDDVTMALLSEEYDLLKVDTAFDRYMLKGLKDLKIPSKCMNAKRDFLYLLTDVLIIKGVLRAKNLGYDYNRCLVLDLGVGNEIQPWRFQSMIKANNIMEVVESLEGTSYHDILKANMDLYKQTGSLQVLESTLDRCILKKIKDISLRYYQTMGPLLRFLVSKEYEVRNLKVIIKNIDSRMPYEQVKALLVIEEG
ncbi:MAG: V-type ATPase subunit [Candidatus Thermoplasmatota archaeon]